MTLLTKSIRTVAVLSCLSIGLLASSARAASVSHTGNFPLSPYLSNGSYVYSPASFPKFNLAGQCLTSVCFRLDGGSVNDFGYENFLLFPVRITGTLIATITLQRPDLSPLVVVQPTVVISDSVTAFDGVADYAGTSGNWQFSVPAADSDSTCVTGAGDLALFTGAGTIGLPGFAIDGSYQVGAGSWSLSPRSFATITVTYNYRDCSVPVATTTWSGIKRLNP